jgi:hexokinase
MINRFYEVGLPFVVMIGCLFGIGYNSAYIKSHDLSQGLFLVLGASATYLERNNKSSVTLINREDDVDINQK